MTLWDGTFIVPALLLLLKSMSLRLESQNGFDASALNITAWSKLCIVWSPLLVVGHKVAAKIEKLPVEHKGGKA